MSSGTVVAARLRAGPGPHALVFANGAVWALTWNALTRLEIGGKRRRVMIHVGRFPKAIAAGGGRIWVVNAAPFSAPGSLVAVDPATNRLIGRPLRLGLAPAAIATTRNGVWVVDGLEGMPLRIDPAARRIVARTRVGRSPTNVVAGAGAVWVANTADGTVSRIDPETNRVTMTVRVGLAPRGVAVGAGAIWVAAAGDGSVRRLDPENGRVSLAARGLGDPLAAAVTHGHLWVSSNGDGEVVRVRLP
jgi:YVTN family beta-propeller protein